MCAVENEQLPAVAFDSADECSPKGVDQLRNLAKFITVKLNLSPAQRAVEVNRNFPYYSAIPPTVPEFPLLLFGVRPNARTDQKLERGAIRVTLAFDSWS